MAEAYDARHIAGFFDAYGEREWKRFGGTPADRVNLYLHQHYLRRHIRPGMQVLDAGAGPGRFTIELARLGATVTVGDISKVQLEYNRRRVAEAGFEHAVRSRELLDITDLSRYPEATFDATVCFGGPISYVMDRADEAVAELLRVTKPGGYLLVSVMSKVGATRVFLPGVLSITRERGAAFANGVLDTGILTAEANDGHAMKLYTWSELSALLVRHSCKLVAASAANHLSTSHPEAMVAFYEKEPELWQTFLAWELRVCAEPGALDGGTHIIAVVKKG